MTHLSGRGRRTATAQVRASFEVASRIRRTLSRLSMNSIT
jgi:hypothetical protein